MNEDVLAAASDQQSILANLLELYAYDLGLTFDLQLQADGRYGYDSLPFLIKVNGI